MKALKKLKRLVLILIAGIAVFLLSIVIATNPSNKQINNIDWKSYSNPYYYQKLSDEQKTLYEKLDEQCYSILQSDKDIEYMEIEVDRVVKTYTYSMSKKELSDMYRYFRHANPQYYFVSYACLCNSNTFYLQLADDDYKSAETRKEVRSQMAKVLVKCQNMLTLTKMLPRKPVRIFHDYVIFCCNYDYKLRNRIVSGKATEKELQRSQSVASIAAEGNGVCVGYAYLYSMFCNANNIENYIVSNGKHMWNRVKSGNKWVNVDCTWDSTGSGHKYFMISDSQMEKLDSDKLHQNPKL